MYVFDIFDAIEPCDSIWRRTFVFQYFRPCVHRFKVEAIYGQPDCLCDCILLRHADTCSDVGSTVNALLFGHSNRNGVSIS